MKQNEALQGGYQEALRVIGAWLDIRGLHSVRIVESDGELLIEATHAAAGQAAAAERFRLDRESLDRLSRAAKHDRGAALSRAIFNRNGELSPA